MEILGVVERVEDAVVYAGAGAGISLEYHIISISYFDTHRAAIIDVLPYHSPQRQP
jgi:hypothetical protein